MSSATDTDSSTKDSFPTSTEAEIDEQGSKHITFNQQPPAYQPPLQEQALPGYIVQCQGDQNSDQKQHITTAQYPNGPAIFIAAPQQGNLLPRELQPSDYLVVSIVVALACGIFNVSSLFFSVPALVCSMLAFERRKNGEYKMAKKLGTLAIIFCMVTVTWVVVGGVIAVGMLTYTATHTYA